MRHPVAWHSGHRVTRPAISAYAGRQGDRAGEGMRLRLFDRIRRLVHPRRSQAAGTVLQGRPRRDQRPAPGYSPSAEPPEPPLLGPPPTPADIAPGDGPPP